MCDCMCVRCGADMTCVVGNPESGTQWPIPITRVNARNTFAIRGRLVRGLGPPPRGDPSASPPAGSGVLAARTRARPRTVFDHVRNSTTYGIRPRTVFDHVRYSTTYGLIGHVPGRLVDVRVRRNGRPRPVVRVLACLLFPLNHIQRRRVARDAQGRLCDEAACIFLTEAVNPSAARTTATNERALAAS